MAIMVGSLTSSRTIGQEATITQPPQPVRVTLQSSQSIKTSLVLQ
ncbi:hypothetical protein LSH36_204g10010 [Paralvinella palmiformis]|uniref:Uncharacterized protein n=1 Tax=Paralvinella palmiformis TaxID=53620 RepID=A0AAD9JP61_9ANNE|nr:hypothetical protein LSH36_204g10010 [Paralvinella palmiformis]